MQKHRYYLNKSLKNKNFLTKNRNDRTCGIKDIYELPIPILNLEIKFRKLCPRRKVIPILYYSENILFVTVEVSESRDLKFLALRYSAFVIDEIQLKLSGKVCRMQHKNDVCPDSRTKRERPIFRDLRFIFLELWQTFNPALSDTSRLLRRVITGGVRCVVISTTHRKLCPYGFYHRK